MESSQTNALFSWEWIGKITNTKQLCVTTVMDEDGVDRRCDMPPGYQLDRASYTVNVLGRRSHAL